MASREEQKRKAREEREQKERQEAEAKAKRRRRIRIAAIAGAVAVVAIIAIVVMSSGGSSKKTPPALESGLQVSPGPWQPDTEHLQERSKTLGLPDPSDTLFHIHAHLDVYTNGKRQPVPGNIGIDPKSQFLASLHTHNDQGVIHMEAVRPFPFKLGQFFEIWGVKFTPTQLGAYHPGNGLVLQTWVNGKEIKNQVGYIMKPHDLIIVGFGKPGSFPTKSKYKFEPGE